MNSLLKIFILCCGVLFSYWIIHLLLKKRINERNSIAWLFTAICILVVSANPEILDHIATKLKISYPPSLLFLLSNLVLLIFVLYQSIQISLLNEKVTKLTQYVALLKPGHGDENKKSENARNHSVM